jgi:hypothetical protein
MLLAMAYVYVGYKTSSPNLLTFKAIYFYILNDFDDGFADMGSHQRVN